VGQFSCLWVVIAVKSRLSAGKIYLLCLTLSTFAYGCAPAQVKPDIAALIKSSIAARTAGHEDLAANELKEAYEQLPPGNSPKRLEAINQLYLPTLDLAAELSKSGRFSLSKTMYDKAIEVEAECTLANKPSATKLKRETEKVFETEETIMTKAATGGEMKTKIVELQNKTKDLASRLSTDEPSKIEREARKHLEVMRSSFGVASYQYLDTLRVLNKAMSKQGAYAQAIEIVETDIKHLTDFKQEDLKNADADAIQNVYFLIPLYCELSSLQVKDSRFDDAVKAARKAQEFATLVGGNEKGRLVDAQIALGVALHAKGDDGEAISVLKRAHRLAQVEHRGKESARIRRLIHAVEGEHVRVRN